MEREDGLAMRSEQIAWRLSEELVLGRGSVLVYPGSGSSHMDQRDAGLNDCDDMQLTEQHTLWSLPASKELQR